MRTSGWALLLLLVAGSSNAVSSRRQTEEMRDRHRSPPLDLTLGLPTHSAKQDDLDDTNLSLSLPAIQRDRGKEPMTDFNGHEPHELPLFPMRYEEGGGSEQESHEGELEDTHWLPEVIQNTPFTPQELSMASTSAFTSQAMIGKDKILQDVCFENGLGTHLSPEELAWRVRFIHDNRFSPQELGKFVATQVTNILPKTEEGKRYFRRYQLFSKKLSYKKYQTDHYMRSNLEYTQMNEGEKKLAIMDRMDDVMKKKANPKKRHESRARKESKRMAEESKANVGQVFEQHFWENYGKDVTEIPIDTVEKEARDLKLDGINPKRFTVLLNQYLETQRPDFNSVDFKWLRLKHSKQRRGGKTQNNFIE